MNVWTFSGRVGADAELRTTQSGEKVLSFRVANDIGFGDRKTTQWVDCSMWGRRAEAVANYVRKGGKVTVSGEVKLEEFQRRDGTPGAKLAVRVNEIELAGRDDSNDSQDQRSAGRPQGGGYGGGRPQGGGGGRDYGSEPPRGGAGGRGGGKPVFDQDLDDEVPF
jgi:single-strand DNA-binding protein